MNTEADYMALNKNQLVSMIVELKKENITLRNLSSKLEDIDQKVEQFGSELSISKTVNNLLNDRIISLERKLANQAQ